MREGYFGEAYMPMMVALHIMSFGLGLSGNPIYSLMVSPEWPGIINSVQADIATVWREEDE